MVCVLHDRCLSSFLRFLAHFTHPIYSLAHLFTHHSSTITHLSIHSTHPPTTLCSIMHHSVHDLTELRRAALRGLARTHGDDVEAVAPLMESFVAMRSSGEDRDRDRDRDRDTQGQGQRYMRVSSHMYCTQYCTRVF